jgi:hypothetical protein
LGLFTALLFLSVALALVALSLIQCLFFSYRGIGLIFLLLPASISCLYRPLWRTVVCAKRDDLRHERQHHIFLCSGCLLQHHSRKGGVSQAQLLENSCF